MNYRSLQTVELERLAYLGDAEAARTLGGAVREMVSTVEAEQESANSYEEGEEAGYKAACADMFSKFAEPILAASNGNRDEDVCANLAELTAFLEENS